MFISRKTGRKAGKFWVGLGEIISRSWEQATEAVWQTDRVSTTGLGRGGNDDANYRGKSNGVQLRPYTQGQPTIQKHTV